MRSLRLGLLGLVHVLADGYAFCIPPLLGVLILRFGVDPIAVALAPAVMTVGHSVLQPIFGLLADRHRGWWLTALGVLVAGGGVALIGWTDNYLVVLLLVFVAGLGVGATHPAAVTAAGRLMPRRRGLAVALFLFAGTLGLAIGPLSATALVEQGGLKALVWVLLPGCAVAAAVMLMLPKDLTGSDKRHHRPASLSEEVRHTFRLLADRRHMLFPLWLMAAVRNMVVISVVTLLPFHLGSAGGEGLTKNVGWPMAVFLFAGGVGGVVYSSLRTNRRDTARDTGRLMICVVPLILLFPFCRLFSTVAPEIRLVEMGLLGLIGGLVAATVPSVTALFQHLVPERENVAATLSMGLAWGVGGLAGPLLCGVMIQWMPGLTGRLVAFWVVGAICLIGGLLAWRAQGRLYGGLVASKT